MAGGFRGLRRASRRSWPCQGAVSGISDDRDWNAFDSAATCEQGYSEVELQKSRSTFLYVNRFDELYTLRCMSVINDKQ